MSQPCDIRKLRNGLTGFKLGPVELLRDVQGMFSHETMVIASFAYDQMMQSKKIAQGTRH